MAQEEMKTPEQQIEMLRVEIKRQLKARTEITSVGYPHVILDGEKLLTLLSESPPQPARKAREFWIYQDSINSLVREKKLIGYQKYRWATEIHVREVLEENENE